MALVGRNPAQRWRRCTNNAASHLPVYPYGLTCGPEDARAACAMEPRVGILVDDLVLGFASRGIRGSAVV